MVHFVHLKLVYNMIALFFIQYQLLRWQREKKPLFIHKVYEPLTVYKFKYLWKMTLYSETNVEFL